MANTVTLEYRGVGNQLIDESRKVDNAVNKVGDTSKKSSGVMASSFKYAAASLAAAGIGALFKNMFDEAKEAQQVSASTAQGIKTMGAASWITAKQVGDLSEAISNKIGVDDELIQSSANLLLTFGKVKNAVGKNNDIFNRAVAASQDLAAKGFGDANSAAKMLGKALNDPIKGITALSRAGVTFDKGQIEQIKHMVKAGDVLGAQKMIMAEVEKQVKGTAEATATGADKMKVRWGNFQEQLGTAFMPVLEKVLTLLMQFVSWASEHQAIVIALAAITAGIWLLNAALNANPIILVISLIAALVVGLIALWEKSAGFRDFWIGAWNVIKNVAVAVAHGVANVWNWLWARGSDVVHGIVNAFWAVVNFFKALPGRIRSAVGVIWDIITWPFRKAYQIIAGIIGGIIGFINNAIGALRSLVGLANNPTLSGGGGITRAAKAARSHHAGGVITGGIPGQEVMRRVQVGERVSPVGGSGSAGNTIQFAGNLSDPLAVWVMNAIKNRQIIIPGVNA